MRRPTASSSYLFLFLLCCFHGLHAASTATDTATVVSLDTHWELVRSPATFEPAGWQSTEVPALTRVQAVKMGLTITDFVDERFDPVKGKQAASQYYGQDVAVSLIAVVAAAPGNVLLSAVADEAQIKLRALEAANPHLNRDVLPKGAALYGVQWSPLPEDWTALVQEQQEYEAGLVAQYEKRKKQVLSFQPDPSTHDAITYTVRTGDYLGRISTTLGVKVSDLQKWNRIKGNTIYPGQKLTVWVPSKKQESARIAASAPKETPKTASATEAQAPNKEVLALAGNYLSYEVKPGDTLWGIANKFPGVSADNIKTWNKVDELIKAGDRLKINTQTITDYSPDKYPSTL
ncbi:MAG: LysM peptidoglycan-binding domain-containing protein [Schleiferiaceae bacterium]|nr:LysM peptidoglycan-binding domain-containing protein [Schleiferiaceae bacterium]